MSYAMARDRALEFVDRLQVMGPISITRFFSGAGLVKDGVQFAFVIQGTLYLRVDDLSRVEFEALGSSPFRYATRAKKVSVASYYELPDEIAEDAELLELWITKAWSAAASAKSSDRRGNSRLSETK